MNYFSLILGLGVSIGLLRVLLEAPKIYRLRWILTALAVITLSLLFSRLVFTTAYFSYFINNLLETLNFWEGGLSWFGAVVGFMLATFLVSVLFRLPWNYVMDNASVMILPIAVAIWLGGWQAGIAYGIPLEAGTWWGVYAKDEAGILSLRAPLQLSAAVGLLIILVIAEKVTRTNQNLGVKAGAVGLAGAVHTLLFSFMRRDPVQMVFGLRLDSWAAVAVLAGVLLLIFTNYRKKKFNKKPVNGADK